MSYQLYFVADMGADAVGLTMNGKLLDAVGAQVGAVVTSGIAEVAPGAYAVLLTIPDNHIGAFVLMATSNAAMRAVFAINPQEGEYLNARVDSRLAAAAYSAPPTVAGIWGHAERTLTTPFPTFPTNLTAPTAVEIRQEMDASSTRLALLDAPISGRAATSDVATASSALLGAIAGLHNLSAADIDARLAAYGAATGGEVAAALVALQAMIGALHNLSSSEAQAAAAAALAAPVTEPTGAFDWQSATLGDIVAWIGAIHRNKMQQGAALQTLRNSADTADIATAATLDDGATLTRGAWA